MDTQNKNQEDNRPKIENHMENCNVFMGDSYGGIFPLPGAQVTIHQHLDPKKMKKGEGQQTYGNVESKEERDQRKVEVMKAITDKFEFEDEQLGYDKTHKRITNDRLASLFRKCFGFSYVPPTAENRVLQERLWVLLIDKRTLVGDDEKGTEKLPGEDYFRPTVLNIIGYFLQNKLLCGTKGEILQTLFPNSNSNLAKNIERGLSPTCFEGMSGMIDHYIEQLQNGEF